MIEEEKAPQWAERLMNRLDELEKKLEKKEEKPLFAALRAGHGKGDERTAAKGGKEKYR
jgi:ABC-type Fe3+-hydroxamate transport system substrate-binding protein